MTKVHTNIIKVLYTYLVNFDPVKMLFRTKREKCCTIIFSHHDRSENNNNMVYLPKNVRSCNNIEYTAKSLDSQCT